MYTAEPLSVDHHLKVVREITWEARARWNDLGRELAVPQGKLQVCVCVSGIHLCCTSLLYIWNDCTNTDIVYTSMHSN